MLEATIEISNPPEWIKALVRDHAAFLRIRSASCNGSRTRDLIDIFLPKDSGVENISIGKDSSHGGGNLVKVDRCHAMAMVDTDDCQACKNLGEMGIFIQDSWSTESGSVSFSIVIPNEETISILLESFERDQVNYKLISKRDLKKKSEITGRQEYIIRTALSMGFFDQPRRINLETLAKKLGISYVTLSEILRRGEKHILTSYFSMNGNTGQ